MTEGGPVTRMGQSLISALPPAFLLLLVMNLLFLGFVTWLMKDQLERRDDMARELFERCLAVALHDTP
jgi:hypothetical protein